MRAIFAALILCLACDSANSAEVMIGLASIDYGRVTRFDGQRYHGLVATGARFRASSFAVAHRTLPLKSCVAVAYRGKVETAMIVDRGPCLSKWCQQHAPKHVRDRELDMTPALAQRIKFPGLGRVSYWPVACTKS